MPRKKAKRPTGRTRDIQKQMKKNHMRVVPKQKSRKQAPPKKNKNGLILVTILFLFFLFYICGYVISLMNKQTIPYTTVLLGSVDSPQIMNGVIIRDEEVYRSPTDGALYYEVSNLDRVPKGSVVGTIRKEEEIQSIQENIERLEESILKGQDRREDFSLYDEDVRRIDADMKVIVDGAIHKFLDGNTSELYALKDNLEKHMNIRNQMRLTEARGSVTTMVQERNIYQSRLYENMATLRANAGGILSYSLDGYEESVLLENRANLPRELFETEWKGDIVTASGLLAEDEPVFKIVNSNHWFIATYIENHIIPVSWKEGASAVIYIRNDDNETFDAQEVVIESIVTGASQSYIVMKSTKNMTKYINKRGIAFKITPDVYEGLKIPVSAVVNQTLLKIPLTYVQDVSDGSYILKQGFDKNTLVSIVAKGTDESGEYIYVLQDFVGISVGDTILMPDATQPFQVTEVENARGVYLLNSGIATFRTIQIDENTPQNSSHMILDAVKNTSIRVHDRIVSDARNIEEGQNVF